ncbi:MAG: ATP-binding protein [Muribaculaceae bacterium]|nr:ATP-binding protein [Muribaculaceae bacterium]
MIELRRKIDKTLRNWKSDEKRLPMIVKGARQIGKTFSIERFGRQNYRSMIVINFILQPEFRHVFDNGYDVDTIVRNITFINPELEFVPGETLLFFDELQQCPPCATALKSFAIDGRYDVICSGSLMGISYNEIESNAVGYKTDVEMFSLDFEEFLWAKGYDDEHIEPLFGKLCAVEPLTTVEFDVLSELFKDFMVVGGMPAVVDNYISNGNFSGTLAIQRQLLNDYREDITKYAAGLDKAKILNVYNHISVFLGRDNKKFQISKVARNARNRDYIGVIDWLASAGIVNPCYCLSVLELPLKGNYNQDNYKLYFQDTGLLVASLDEEAQEDLRHNRNLGTYKGALYENAVGDMLRKQGYDLYFYRNDKSTIELDFIVRDTRSLVPIEVKAGDNTARSLAKVTDGRVSDIAYGIKMGNQNIGFNGQYYTMPYFLGFMLRRFLRTRNG